MYPMSRLILRVDLKKGESVALDIKLQPSAISVGEVKVIANKRRIPKCPSSVPFEAETRW